MKNALWISLTLGLALFGWSCGSGGGGSGGGRLFVTSCTLGCTNGTGGSQVSCGIINVAENQDIALVFSEPIDPLSVTGLSFQIFDVLSADVPSGTFIVDPNNNRRVIFRPTLFFDQDGIPSYGFAKNASYQIKIPGSAQGDTGPYIRSANGKANESRMLCTIVTSEDLVDPKPGSPTYALFVETIDPVTMQRTTGVPAAGAINVASDSTVTIVFDDLMNLGTVVTPSSGQAPFINIRVDPNDGNPLETINGSWTFDVDQDSLVTTAVFTPDAPGFPSAGSNPLAPRRILVEVIDSVVDLANNAVTNPGTTEFIPVVQTFGQVTIPAGGEQFIDQDNLDGLRTGADWGETQVGRLKPGTGGGSGRLGDLEIGLGEVVDLYTSPIRAEGRIRLNSVPLNAEFATITLTDPTGPTTTSYVFRKNPNAGQDPIQVKSRPYISYCLMEMANFLNDSVDPTTALASYWVENDDTLVVSYDTPGDVGNSFVIDAFDSGTNPVIEVIQPMSGGRDAQSFQGPDIVTNFDFQANPGGMPPPIDVVDGIFEYASIRILNGGTLRLHGDNPARVFARGALLLEDGGVIDISGENAGMHSSDSPRGEQLGYDPGLDRFVGAAGGPAGGWGGAGADRPDNTGTDLTALFPASEGFDTSGIFSAGIENASVNYPPFINGWPGLGVDLALGAGSGIGGKNYPFGTFPPSIFAFAGLATNLNCDSDQVAGPGSGGAFADDGTEGVPMAAQLVADWPVSMPSNTPLNTPAGDATTVGLEPPSATPLSRRKLTPKNNFLDGGAGGGGGAAHIAQTGTVGPDATTGDCLVPGLTGTPIDIYRSHSGASGGGGGGAGQFVGGRILRLFGQIDASGGDGGSSQPAALINGQAASPGGGGSGGAILAQGGTVDISFVNNRLVVAGGGGGFGVTGSVGGDGGPGLIRIEGDNSIDLDPAVINQVIDPIDPDFDPFGTGSQLFHDWLSVDDWKTERVPPDSFSGATSCWMKPQGSFFDIEYDSDDLTDPQNPVYGWNMTLFVRIGGSTVTTDYRGSTVFGGLSPQEFWGELLNRDLGVGEMGAPVIVRFQGARSQGAFSDPCDVDVNDSSGPLLPGSVTPWVRHPEELNTFSPKPDTIRFLIVFDGSHPDFRDIEGITDLRLTATPD